MMREMNQEKFKRMCRLLMVIMRFMQIFLWVGIAFVIAAGFLAEIPDEQTGRLVLHTAIVRVMYIFTLGIAANQGAGVFRSMEKSETPFLYDVSDKIKAASYALVIGSVICSFYKFIVTALGTDLLHTAGIETTSPVLMGLILFALVYVIEQGCRLQKESDETL